MELKSIFNNLAAKAGKPRRQILYSRVINKQEAVTRRDIADWKSALQEAGRTDNPRRRRLQVLYNDIVTDALLASQMVLRSSLTRSADFIIYDRNGKADDKTTELIQQSGLYEIFSEFVIESVLYGYSLLEISNDATNTPTVKLIPRKHIEPTTGRFFPDVTDDKFINYRDLPEFGRFIIELTDDNDNIGLLNKAVPHVLIKKFAQSCWSELCEIYGIPPRYIKTDTSDPVMLDRAASMLRDSGAASAWVIDTTEDIGFAQVNNTNGDVYHNLINLCNNEISMLVSGAIIGQDTIHGNRSKEEAAQNLLENITLADQRRVERDFNKKIFPALAAVGFIPEGCSINILKKTDIKELWDMTFQAAQFFDIDTNWVKDTFGIEVTGKRSFGESLAHQHISTSTNQHIDEDFFV